MPVSPYAKLLASVNSGAPTSGGLIVATGDTIQFSGESSAFWTSQKFEITDYPVGFACPSGWSTDAATGNYYYALGVTPPPVTMGAWGKYMCKLTVNGGLQGGQALASLVDVSTALKIPSPVLALNDIGFQETKQFSASKLWTGDWKADLRILDAAFVNLTGVVDPDPDTIPIRDGSGQLRATSFATASANVAGAGALRLVAGNQTAVAAKGASHATVAMLGLSDGGDTLTLGDGVEVVTINVQGADLWGGTGNPIQLNGDTNALVEAANGALNLIAAAGGAVAPVSGAGKVKLYGVDAMTVGSGSTIGITATGDLTLGGSGASVAVKSTGLELSCPATFDPVAAPAAPGSGWRVYADTATGLLDAVDASGRVEPLAGAIRGTISTGGSPQVLATVPVPVGKVVYFEAYVTAEIPLATPGILVPFVLDGIVYAGNYGTSGAQIIGAANDTQRTNLSSPLLPTGFLSVVPSGNNIVLSAVAYTPPAFVSGNAYTGGFAAGASTPPNAIGDGTNSFVSNDGGKFYVCTSGGTDGSSGGPTGTGPGAISVGGLDWYYVGLAATGISVTYAVKVVPRPG